MRPGPSWCTMSITGPGCTTAREPDSRFPPPCCGGLARRTSPSSPPPPSWRGRRCSAWTRGRPLWTRSSPPRNTCSCSLGTGRGGCTRSGGREAVWPQSESEARQELSTKCPLAGPSGLVTSVGISRFWLVYSELPLWRAPAALSHSVRRFSLKTLQDRPQRNILGLHTRLIPSEARSTTSPYFPLRPGMSPGRGRVTSLNPHSWLPGLTMLALVTAGMTGSFYHPSPEGDLVVEAASSPPGWAEDLVGRTMGDPPVH